MTKTPIIYRATRDFCAKLDHLALTRRSARESWGLLMSLSASHQTLIAFASASITEMQRMLETVPDLLSQASAGRLDWMARNETDLNNAEVLASRAALIRLCLEQGVGAAFGSLTTTPAPVSEEQLCDAVRQAFDHIETAPASMPRQIVAWYECALRSIPANLPPQQLFKMLTDRCEALFNLGVLAGNRTILRGAVHCFDAALGMIDSTVSPGHWAALQQNRGNALTRLGELAGDQQIVRSAVAGFDAALQGFLLASDEDNWAATQQARANALESLFELTGDRAVLEDSLTAYDAALEIHTRKSHPDNWALAQQNRGNALRSLGELTGDPSIIEQAIAAFDGALEIRTRAANATAWAGTQQNRADALSRLGEFHRSPPTLLLAVGGYDAALEIIHRETGPANWARIRQNKAIALVRIGDLRRDPISVRQAVEEYEAALTVRTLEAGPMDWAITRRNLAVALYTLGGLIGDQALLREALAIFEDVLKIVSQEGSGAQWAGVQSSRADTLRLLGDLADDAAITDEAIDIYRQALGAMSMEGAPDSYMATCASLVRPLFARGEYDEIRVLLDEALSAGFKHLLKLTDRVARERAIQQAAWLAELRAWIAIAIDTDAAEAVLWLERGRAQLLAIALGAAPDGASATNLAARPELLGAIPEGGAAILPIITPSGARVAVIPAGRDTVNVEDFLELPNLTRTTLEDWFYGSEGGAAAGYLASYHAAKGRGEGTTGDRQGDRSDSFGSILRSTLEQVWYALLGPVDARLQELGLAAQAPVVIVPPGLLSLLPLWAAAPDLQQASNAEPFGSRWALSLSPSLAVLAVAQCRGAAWLAQGAPVSALAVLDPTSDGQTDLPGAALEGRIVALAVGRDRLLMLGGAKATAGAVRSGLAGRTHLHFSTHGFYAPSVPSLSAILLAGADRLTLGELQKLDAIDHLRLVVLSACDTGLPGLQRGRADEFIGLPAGFIQAGAAAVIASHWPVRDDATFFLMWKFYQAYLDGEGRVARNPAEALRRASLWLRSVTHGDLEALFEPMRDGDGCAIPRTIDRNRPRGISLDDSRDDEEAVTDPAPASAPVLSFAAWQKFRRVEDVAPASTAFDGHASAAKTSSAYFLAGDEAEWALSRPFADPVHWAAFSITGI